MLQNINLNGNNINGTLSIGFKNTVAAGCDLCVERFDLGKPLSKTSVPHAKTVRSYPAVSTVSRSRSLHQRMQPEMWQIATSLSGTTLGEAVASMPAALEPPAAAWASFVIARTTSV